MIKIIQNLTVRHLIFLVIIITSLSYNVWALGRQLSQEYRFRKEHPFQFWGERAQGILPWIKDEVEITYLSDRNFEQDHQEAYFYQIQHALAPVRLDRSGKLYDYALFDFEQQQNALHALKSQPVKPIFVNPYGILIAEVKR